MTVYKYLLKIVKTKKIIILANLAMFLIIILLNSPSTNKEVYSDRSIKLGVVNLVEDSGNSDLVKYLEDKHDVIFVDEDINKINEDLFLSKYSIAIILDKNKIEIIGNERSFSDKLYLRNQINKYINYTDMTGNNKDLLEKVLSEEVDVIIVDKEKYEGMENTEKLTSVFNFSSYILTSIIMSISIGILSEFKDKVLVDRIRVSGISILSYEAQIYLALLTINLAISSLCIGIVAFIYRNNLMNSNFSMYVVNTYIFSISIICFSYLVDNIFENLSIKNGITTIFSLGMSFISGAMVPQYLIADKVISFSKIFPAYYYISGNTTIATGEGDLFGFLRTQILFSLLFIILGLYFSKLRTDRN